MHQKTILTLFTVLFFALTGAIADPAADKTQKDGKGKGGGKPDAETVFKAIDADGNGSITAKELGDSKRFKDASKKDVGEAFKKKDLNEDGAISKHEFMKTFGKGDKSGKKGGKGGKGGKKS